MDFAAGTWDLTGSENFDEYMKVVGKNIYVLPNNHNQTHVILPTIVDFWILIIFYLFPTSQNSCLV